MDEGGWLERVVGRLAGHLLGSQAAEFPVHDGEKPGRGLVIAAFHPRQDLGDLAHGVRAGGFDVPIQDWRLCEAWWSAWSTRLGCGSFEPWLPVLAR